MESHTCPFSMVLNTRALSEMEESATLDVIDGQYNADSDSEDEAEMWGRCFPVGKGFMPQGDLSKHLT